MNEERLLKLPEVSARLSLSRTAIYRLMARGEIHPVRIGGALRFSEAAVNRFIQRLTQEGSSHANPS